MTDGNSSDFVESLVWQTLRIEVQRIRPRDFVARKVNVLHTTTYKNAHFGIAVPCGTSWEYPRAIREIPRPESTQSNVAELTVTRERFHIRRSASSTYTPARRSSAHMVHICNHRESPTNR